MNQIYHLSMAYDQEYIWILIALDLVQGIELKFRNHPRKQDDFHYFNVRKFCYSQNFEVI